MSEQSDKSPLARAAKYVGSRAELARLLGVTKGAVWQWERESLPAERVLSVASATDWRITPHELRPDLYPNPADGLPDPSRSPRRPLLESGQGAKPELQTVAEQSNGDPEGSGGCMCRGGEKRTATAEISGEV